MSKPELFFIAFIVLVFVTLVSVISWVERVANECNKKGGAYVHGQCLKAEVIK